MKWKLDQAYCSKQSSLLFSNPFSIASTQGKYCSSVSSVPLFTVFPLSVGNSEQPIIYSLNVKMAKNKRL